MIIFDYSLLLAVTREFIECSYSHMVFPGQRFFLHAVSWLILLGFLPKDYVTTGTRFDVFHQTPSEEDYIPDFRLYHNLSKLNECIYDLVSRYPNILDAQMRYRSRWGLSQYVLHFGNLTFEATKTSQNKVKILLMFGEHSSEYLPVESMIYLIKNLTSGMDEPKGSLRYNATEFVLNNVDLYLIGMFNPDGRTVIEKTQNYCWKLTASRADLNFHDYDKAVSIRRQILVEPECRVLTDLTGLVDFDVAISFHSGENQIVVPLRDSKSASPNPMYPDNDEVVVLASVLSSSVARELRQTFINQSQYQYGESIFSHTTITRKIPFTYTISLWRSDTDNKESRNEQCFARANPPSHHLKKILKSFNPLYISLFKHVVHWKQTKQAHLAKTKKVSVQYSMVPSVPYLLFYIILTVLILMFITKLHLPLGWKVFYRRQRRIVNLRTLSSVFSFFVI